MPSSRRPSFSATRRLLRVAGHDRRLHAVQAELLEPVAHDERHAFGHVAAARVPLVDPVADEARLERAAQHAAEAHLADERAVAQEDAEPVRGVELALALPRAAPGPERLAVGDGIGRARLRQRLPRLEPVAAADADRRATRRSRATSSGRSITRGPASDASRRPLIDVATSRS